MTEPVVRFVTADDLAAWRQIRLRSLREDPGAFCATLDREEQFTEARWRSQLAPPSTLVLAGDEPVGMGSGYVPQPGTLQVVAMWVDPAWRGRGLSARVLDLIVGWAGERDLDVRLDVMVDNAAARAAYLAYGFVPSGRIQSLGPGSSRSTETMVLPRPAR